MKIQEIYDKYKIMPQLQLHMLRVTGVAQLICDSFQKPIDRESIITACLIHDIGNMVRFDLKKFPEHLKPKGYKYWKKVQDEYFEKYGKDDYQATYKILKELGISTQLFNLINTMEFRKAPGNSKSKSYEIKISQYADMRVAPYGVTLLDERLQEVQDRFMRNKGISKRLFKKYRNGVREIEKQIFAHCTIKPTDITDRKVLRLMGKLKDFDIKTK